MFQDVSRKPSFGQFEEKLPQQTMHTAVVPFPTRGSILGCRPDADSAARHNETYIAEDAGDTKITLIHNIYIYISYIYIYTYI